MPREEVNHADIHPNHPNSKKRFRQRIAQLKEYGVELEVMPQRLRPPSHEIHRERQIGRAILDAAFYPLKDGIEVCIHCNYEIPEEQGFYLINFLDGNGYYYKLTGEF